MQDQIDIQHQSENKMRDSNPPLMSSWSDLYSKYTHIVKMKEKRNAFIKPIFGTVLIAMLPANVQYLFSLTPIGNSFYTLIGSVFVALFLIQKINFKRDSLLNIHVGLMYMIAPIIFIVSQQHFL